jgi:hypothetical protein
MEREATGERTREAVRHIRSMGYHFGKTPYGHRAIAAPDHPRFKILVEHAEEQAVLMRLKEWVLQGIPISEMAERLNTDGTKPPQGAKWTKSLLYNLKLRQRWQKPRPYNQRPHSDEEVKQRMLDLRATGHTCQQIATALNQQNYMPLKGSKFTEASVRKLLKFCDETKHLTPKRYLENLLVRLEREHSHENPDEAWRRPGYPRLAKLLSEAGYVTPKGHSHWWPAQVQQLLQGRFDSFYDKKSRPQAS